MWKYRLIDFYIVYWYFSLENSSFFSLRNTSFFSLCFRTSISKNLKRLDNLILIQIHCNSFLSSRIVKHKFLRWLNSFSWGFISHLWRSIMSLFISTIITCHLKVFVDWLVLLFNRFILNNFLLFLLIVVNLNVNFLFWCLFLWLFFFIFLFHHGFWTFYYVVNIAQFLSHYLYCGFMNICLWCHVLYSFFIWMNFLSFIMFWLTLITQNIML